MNLQTQGNTVGKPVDSVTCQEQTPQCCKQGNGMDTALLVLEPPLFTDHSRTMTLTTTEAEHSNRF